MRPSTADLIARREHLNQLIEQLNEEIETNFSMMGKNRQVYGSNPFSGSSFKWGTQYVTTNDQTSYKTKADRSINIADKHVDWVHKEKRGKPKGYFTESFNLTHHNLGKITHTVWLNHHIYIMPEAAYIMYHFKF